MTTTSDTQTSIALEPREGTPPIVCRPWCKEGDGHAGEYSGLDQRCTGESAIIPRTLKWKWRDVGGDWHDPELEVFVVAGRDHHPAVVLYSMADDAEVLVTANEARQLAKAFEAAANTLEGKQQ